MHDHERDGSRRDKMFISHADDLNIHANAQHSTAGS